MTLLDETASIEALSNAARQGTDSIAPHDYDGKVDLTKTPVDLDPTQFAETTNNYVLSDQVRKWSGRVLVGAVMLSGAAAAAEYSIFHGPPAHIKTEILADPDSPGSGTLNLEIKPKLNQDVTPVYGGAFTWKIPSSARVLGHDIAVDIHLDSSNLSFVKNNAFDYGKFVKFGTSLVGYKSDLERITAETKWHYEKRAGLASGLALAIELAGLATAIGAKRQYDEQSEEVQAALRKFGKWAIPLGAIVFSSLGGIYAFSHDPQQVKVPHRNELQVDHHFDGIKGLEGSEVDSIATFWIDKGIDYAKKELQEINNFETNAVNSYKHESQLVYGTDAIPVGDDVELAINGDDLQGRKSMAVVLARVAALTHAKYLFLPGDQSLSGFDTFVPDAIKDNIGKHVDVEALISEHDSPTIRQADKKDGFTVTKAENGIRLVKNKGDLILMGDLPLRAALGTQAEEIPPYIPSFTSQMITDMCTYHPNIIVVHDKTVSQAMINANCAHVDPKHNTLTDILNYTKIFYDGRSFYPVQPHYDINAGTGVSYEITAGSTGGNTPSLRPSVLPNDTAAFITFGRRYKKLNIYTQQVLTVEPDGRMVFGAEQLVNPDDADKFTLSEQSLLLGSDSVPPLVRQGRR